MISDHNKKPLFVWVYLDGESHPVVAGRIDFPAYDSGKSFFIYGKSYLSRSNAFAIDPVSLPLKDGTIVSSGLKGMPACIMDCCPDRWGIKVIDSAIGAQPYPEGYLLLNDPGRSGALAISESEDAMPSELSGRSFTLEELQNAAFLLESGENEVNPELLLALHPGTGGARPKCNITIDNYQWIGKFPSIKDPDLANIPALEHATMSLARMAGINAAETRLVKIGDHDVCLVKRFDREGLHRNAFLSARTVFYADPGFGRHGYGSYARFSRWLIKFGATISDQRELFRRMVFNVLVRNSDDHELNHGLIRTSDDRQWRLSPAYDILPSLQPNRTLQHALLIGKNAEGTIHNLLENCEAFSLGKNESVEIIRQVKMAITKSWRDCCYEAGMDDQQIGQLEPHFNSEHISAHPIFQEAIHDHVPTI